MVRQKILLLSLTLILCLASTGCAGEQLTQEQINQIAEDATGAVTNAETYKFNMQMLTKQTIIYENKANEIIEEGNYTSAGAIDYTNGVSKIVETLKVTAPEEGEQEVTTENYIIDRWKYTKDNVRNLWVKTKISEQIGEAEGRTLVEQQVESLGELLGVSAVKLIGSEGASGADCYVLEIMPDIKELNEQWCQQQIPEGCEECTNAENLAKLFKFKEVSTKWWVAKSNHLLLKSDVDALMEMNPESIGATKEDFEKVVLELSVQIEVHDYNEPISIELPLGALGALEVPSEVK